MPERTVVVASSVGLHARPASLFSQAAAKVGVPVTLTSASGKTVNAASILGVLSLGIGHGEQVTIALGCGRRRRRPRRTGHACSRPISTRNDVGPTA